MWHELKILHSDWYNYCSWQLHTNMLEAHGANEPPEPPVCNSSFEGPAFSFKTHKEELASSLRVFFMKALIMEAVNIMPVVNSED